MGGCFTASHFLRVPQRRNAANPFLPIQHKLYFHAAFYSFILKCRAPFGLHNTKFLYMIFTCWAPQVRHHGHHFAELRPQSEQHTKKRNPLKPLRFKGFVAEAVGFEPTCPCGQLDFESFPPCDFWWKLSEDGSTQRKPKSCGILRILASVFRFYLNPPGFPSSSRFCPEL